MLGHVKLVSGSRETIYHLTGTKADVASFLQAMNEHDYEAMMAVINRLANEGRERMGSKAKATVSIHGLYYLRPYNQRSPFFRWRDGYMLTHIFDKQGGDKKENQEFAYAEALRIKFLNQ